jgi:hypothetical protein
MIEHEDGRVSGSIDRARVAELHAGTDDEELRAYYRDLLGDSEEGRAVEQPTEVDVDQPTEAGPFINADGTGFEPQPAVERDDELEALRAEADALGVKVDKRWGADRLRSEIDAVRTEG